MKDYIQVHYPTLDRSYRVLKEAVREAWDSVTTETRRDIIRMVQDRCMDVILDDGGHPKYQEGHKAAIESMTNCRH